MKVPLSWLREHVEARMEAEELAERLTMTGTKVEAIERRGIPDTNGNLDAYRIGRVVEAGPHPNADRLRLCRVDVGAGEPRQIVCGAPNVAAGQTVAVALPGALLPGAERPLGVAKLRGVESHGMILSETEVALGTESDGIMVLEEGLEPGSRLVDALPAAETVLDLELNPNRPDLLAIYGVARETHAVTEAPLAPLDESGPPALADGEVGDYVALEVDAPDLCPRYMARVLTDVRVGHSPLWLRARLEAAGMRAISNVVDVTNYVMLLTGQPLHAFDLDRVEGSRIVVRRAGEGETITTLDGQERRLDPSMLAICDAVRPAVIAGIFGAATAEVGAGTTRVLLESATFDGPSILRTSHTLGLRTESSARFEKGLARELPPRAMAIACRMLVDVCGARLVPGTLDAHEPAPPRGPLRLRHARVRALLGIEVAPGESAGALRRLGCRVSEGDEAHEVSVPFERAGDLTREVDLVEEVGRLVGLERIPSRLPRVPTQGRRTRSQALATRLAGLAADLGLHEAISYRFVPAADVDRLRLAPDDPRRDLVRLANALSDEMAVMRRSLLPGLLRAAARNQAHQCPAGALFEIGRTYAPGEGDLPDEREWLTALLFGQPPKDHWRARPGVVDVFAATGLAGALARPVGVRLEAVPATAPYGHPTRQAELRVSGRKVGWAGELHPLVLRAFDVTGPAAALGLDLTALLDVAPDGLPQFEDLISVPVSHRDVAVVLDEGIPAARVVAVARGAAPLVREARLFDRYAGAPVPSGKVSLAVRLEIADPGRTLTDEEIDAQVRQVAEALATALGGELRR